jgi:hypothetical protein
MPGGGKNLTETLRELMTAAVAFEKKAARHARIEAERRALLDAITRAQLELSVRSEFPGAKPATRSSQEPSPPPALRGIPGGQRASGKPIRGTPSRKPAKIRQSTTAPRNGRRE